MRLGVISDTHDRLAAIDTALAFFKAENIERVVHCGDWKALTTVSYFAERAASLGLGVQGVLGNNDLDVTGFIDYAATAPGNFHLTEGVLEFTWGSVRVAAYHGHHAPTLRKVTTNPSYDLVLLGHTHKPRITIEDGRLIVNPGSTAFSIPRSKDWKPSVAIVDSDTLTAKIHYLA